MTSKSEKKGLSTVGDRPFFHRRSTDCIRHAHHKPSVLARGELMDKGVSVEFIAERVTFTSAADPFAEIQLNIMASFDLKRRSL
ncbi:hypothetical protein [Arthrobacter zhaoguopingii]|uniref:hypothetical protein n=1 Tax=Arthrobacter zhaoguopingii TaxID=2681491 RepID=UPI001915B917|nr:hypothetical protein [Arthrobacter zhaoguopingii]